MHASHDSTEPSTPQTAARAPYEPPVLEPLGEWSTLTLQQTIPIGGL